MWSHLLHAISYRMFSLVLRPHLSSLVHALFVQLISQFFRKRILADFIVLWPTRKWKIKLSLAYFLFPFSGKKKNRIQKHTFLWPFFWTKQKTNSDLCIPFFFSKKQKRNSKSCIPFSEESTKGIQNDKFLFSFFWRKHKRNSEW